MFRCHALAVAVVVVACTATLAVPARAGSPTAAGEIRKVPAALAVRKELPPPPRGVIDLKFRDLFKLPVGPRGLEASDLLRAADGKKVRMVGFMVQQDPPQRGGFLLSPLPVSAGDEDEGLADDLPPSVIFVELTQAPDGAVARMAGLLQISGTLHLGARDSLHSERISFVHITPDARTSRALRRVTERDRDSPRL